MQLFINIKVQNCLMLPVLKKRFTFLWYSVRCIVWNMGKSKEISGGGVGGNKLEFGTRDCDVPHLGTKYTDSTTGFVKSRNTSSNYITLQTLGVIIPSVIDLLTILPLKSRWPLKWQTIIIYTKMVHCFIYRFLSFCFFIVYTQCMLSSYIYCSLLIRDGI